MKEASAAKRAAARRAKMKGDATKGDAAVAPAASEGEGSDPTQLLTLAAEQDGLLKARGRKMAGQPGKEGALSTPSGERVTQNTQLAALSCSHDARTGGHDNLPVVCNSLV